jgi:hypothetical protein
MTNAVERKRRNPLKPVTSEAFENAQLSLFQQFLCNTDDERDELSNAIDLWDSIPRYSVTRQTMQKMRTPEGFLNVLKIPFQHRGKSLIVIIRPARIEQGDGKSLDYYPSAGEELIEQALRKITSEQHAGFFDKTDYRSGARFTLHMLRREMQERGHTRSYQEIHNSLQILALSTIEIRGAEEDKSQVFAVSPYLPFLAGVTRKDIDANPEAKWIAQFHPLVTQSIDQITYRQFNYQRLMRCRNQLTRWLIHQLVLKYTAASITNSFDMRYSTIKRDSALLNGYKQQRQAIAACDDAWEEVKAQRVLLSLKRAEQRGQRGKLEDVIYTVRPSREFAAEQKAANRRSNNAQTQAGIGKSLAGAGDNIATSSGRR